MSQYILTVIVPNGTSHKFVFPETVPLRRLTVKIAEDLQLPFDTYQLVDPITYLAIDEDATMQSLFPAGIGTLWLRAGQSEDNPALPQELYFVVKTPDKSNAALWKAIRDFIWYMGLIFILTIIIVALLNYEYFQ